MFTTNSNIRKSKKSSTFTQQNHEPSSPKVTCIGQVRGKSKKQAQNLKILSHSSNHNRWVHLPFTICDTFKCLGSEFSCLFPCKSSCFNNNNNNNNSNKSNNNTNNSNNNKRENGCGVVFRWMVSLNEENDVELVVNDDEEKDDERVIMERTCSRRKSIFDDMEFDDLFKNVVERNDNDNDNDGECGRVSICVPPKNALLLMRCRSNPMKMGSISTKCNENVVINEANCVEFDGKLGISEMISEVISEVGEVNDEDLEDFSEEIEKKLEENVEEAKNEKDLIEMGNNDEVLLEVKEIEESNVNSNFTILEKSSEIVEENEVKSGVIIVEKEVIRKKSIEKEKKNDPKLPDCLLLMMCEPKLSMEVSKETWICNTDFVRCIPERHLNQKLKRTEDLNDELSNNSHKKTTKAAAVAALPPSGRSGIQPGRSSISFPTIGDSMAKLIDQKMTSNVGVGYDPFVLTRCKSAPLGPTTRFVSPELGCL